MESKENMGLKERIAKGISEKIEGTGFFPPFPCVILSLGEPKMPMELFMEDCED